MARIIGRNKEIKELHTLYKSDQARDFSLHLKVFGIHGHVIATT